MSPDRRLILAGLLAAPFAARAAEPAPKVALETELGRIVIELYPDKAPVTVANFLAYIDQGLWKDAAFYRVVRPDNDNNPATITVIQGGIDASESRPPPLPPIAHETTAETGLLHTDGVLSMARGDPGTAASEVFICIGDNPALDFGGARNSDGQGFAAFGRVIDGMAVVRAINARPGDAPTDDAYVKGQMLGAPVKVLSATRDR